MPAGKAPVSMPLGGPGDWASELSSQLLVTSALSIYFRGEKASSFTSCVTYSVRFPTSWGAKA